MSRRLKKLAVIAASMVIAATSNEGVISSVKADAAYGVGGNGKAVMEYLDRGIYAVKNGNGMFVSWRYNANDADNAEFRLYRDDKVIYTGKSGDATSFQDNGGTVNSKYRVDCVAGGKVVNSQTCKFKSGTNYFDIKLNRPGNQYSPNDCCVGDVDGDGQYEIFLKWDPSNQKDNSQEGKTDNVYIDCYALEGTQLWRVDLGRNIRAGQHYTQMCVADFDCDGKAELITKTADGTKDGKGKVIGDGSKDYRNGKGYILDGPEYMTLFDGQTGAALDTIDFPVPRGKVSDWGDNYGNRVDRMNSGIAYLDGVHPSAIYGRGYYTRLTWSAVDVKNKKLVKRWVYDSTFNRSTKGWGCGNHNVMVADCDNDGKQEVFTGANCIDDNGKLLWSTGDLHGDAMHVGDFIPESEGLEVFECHEDKPYGETCYDAKTGKKLFHINNTKDTGRCVADNVWAGNKGAEFWGAADGNVYDSRGKKIAGSKPAQNFLIYWDGDLEREILDGTKVSKMTGAGTYKNIFTASGCGSNNGTKNNPSLTVDLFGDWREELILRTDDNSKLRVWCTTETTKVRLTTLMHDMQYRMQNGCQQSAYNQPPHVSYYLGSDAPLPERPNILLNNKPQDTNIPEDVTETATTTAVTTTSIFPEKADTYSRKFDLGANAANGYTSVKASDKYDKSKGYGFSGNDVRDVAAAGRNELSDAVQFMGNTTFNADVPNGLYKVKVTLGNTVRTSIYMENMLQIVNMTGNNAVDEIILPVTDGQLNIRAAAGKEGNAYSISAVEINKISDSLVMPSTIWLCGDSTVCNYYPVDSSSQAGWGQMLGKHIDSGWYIRNMAASGEYAKGFVEHGNFECIEKYGKSGDVFVISIGINDGKYYKGDEYKKIVSDMVKRAKAKGMDVILIKQQGRKGDYSLSPLLKSRYFASELDQIASEQNCQVIDLFTLWQDYCISIGAANADAMYIDNVHPNRAGADKLAELVASKFTHSSHIGTDDVIKRPASDIIDGQVYTFKNAGSGMYLFAERADAANGTNVGQAVSNGKQAQFKAVAAGDGHFYLISQLGDGDSYALDVNGKKTADGTNIELYTFNKGDNQKFRFDKNPDGTYSILTKITDDKSALDVSGRSTKAGANVQQYTFSGGKNQKWYAELADSSSSGDVNADGNFNIADVVLMQKWLIALDGAELVNWRAGDLCEDGRLDIFDLVMMKRALFRK